MKRSIITLVTGAMVSAAALTAGTAFANSNDQAEVALFQKASHDIAAAIRAAETASGGKAVGAEFTDEDGAGLWEVDTVTGTKRAEVNVDATTGQIVKTKDKGDVADKDEPVTPDMLGAPLADLAAKAATEGGGKVMSIDLENENGKPLGLEVEIVKPDGTVHHFLANQTDGKLSPVIDGSDEDGDDDESGTSNG